MEHARQEIRLFGEIPGWELLAGNGKSIVVDTHAMSIGLGGKRLFDVGMGGSGQGGAGDMDLVD